MSRFHTKLDRRRWAKIRLQVLERDGYRCVKCGKAGRLEVDHVLPAFRGGDLYEENNLQALCRSCHIAKTASENRRVWPARDAWRDLVRNRLK